MRCDGLRERRQFGEALGRVEPVDRLKPQSAVLDESDGAHAVPLDLVRPVLVVGRNVVCASVAFIGLTTRPTGDAGVVDGTATA